MPLDSSGNNIELPDSLYFGINYAATGDVSATLEESKTITAAVRPGPVVHPTLKNRSRLRR